jgi:uncharacterized protein (DUF169 family)
MIEILNFKDVSSKIGRILGLEHPVIAVKLVRTGEEMPGHVKAPEKRSRYCQVLMLARHGETLLLTPDQLACPAASAAFGFSPLPEMISSGKMLHTLGLYESPEAAAETMRTMPRLEPGTLSALVVGPLNDFSPKPDVVVVEGLPEQVMWLCLARTFKNGGRLNFSTSIFQCCCVDSTVVPYMTGEINISPGCYGCRSSTDTPDGNMFIGIPIMLLNEIVEGLDGLSRKAIPDARAKQVYHVYVERKEDDGE